MINKKILIDYPPINFQKEFFFVFLKTTGLLFLSWGIFYALSNNSMKEYVSKHTLLLSVIFISFTFLALLQTYYSSSIYIYQVNYLGNQITFKWQKFNQLKTITLAIEKVKVRLIPSGKNTPYVEITFFSEEKFFIIKQTYYSGWDQYKMVAFVSTFNLIKSQQSNIK